VKRWIAFFVLLFSASMALAGSSTLSVLDGLGATQTFGVTTDIGGNFYSNYAIVDGAAAGNKATVTGSNALKVDNSAVTQPVSAASLPLPTGAATAAKQPALGTAGSASTDVLSVQGIAAMTPLKTDGSATTQPVSAASLPLPTGASTAAKQPALGTAGTASSDVLSVQGITSMTPLKVDGSGVTQPVSGTVTANQGTPTNWAMNTAQVGGTATDTNSGLKSAGTQRVVIATDQPNFSTGLNVAATQSGTWTVQPGNTVNTTPWLATINQGGNSATVSAGGALKVDGSAATQPVSIAGNQAVNVAQIGGTSIVTGGVAGLQAVAGPVASGGSNADNPLKVGGVFNTTQPTVTNGQVVDNQSTARGAQIVATGIDTFNVAQTGGGNTGSAVPSGAQYIGGNGSGNMTGITVCDNSTPFSFSSTAAQKIITKAASKKIYICASTLLLPPATNVALIEGTQTTNQCDTSTAGMAGGTTAATGWNFAANGGLTQGTGVGVINKTANANFDVCLLASAANQVSGSIQWTQY
jgi:hypothetical protein